MQISDSTRRLCSLLAAWPRQRLFRWLADQASPIDALATKAQPPKHWQRKTPNDKFADANKLPLGFRGFHHRAVGIFDVHYPEALRNIPDPPLVLFCLGDLGVLDGPCVSVVGARRCTTMGKAVAQSMSAELAGAGCCIVSGLALGIDTAAHKGALNAAGNSSVPDPGMQAHGEIIKAAAIPARSVKTAAVLGSGFGWLYPKQNRGLATTILNAGGLILSEYPGDMQPRPYQFPERNRLISGLSSATVLVEATEQSGSLITARLALEQGRDVCAVPGPPTSPVSRGCHRLIRQGAALVTCAQDVLEELGLPHPEPATYSTPELTRSETSNGFEAQRPNDSTLSTPAAKVYEVLAGQPVQFDAVAELTGLSAQQVSQSLVELQLVGFVRQGADGYIRVP